MDVAAVAALPHAHVVALEHLAGLDAGHQLAVALLVLLLDARHAVEQLGDVGEALLARHLGELGVHLGPLLVLAGSGVGEVLHRGGNGAAVQQLEPELGVLLLVLRRLQEDVLDLDVAVLLGLAGVVLVLGVRLRLAGERVLEVLLGLASFEVHGTDPSLRAPVSSGRG